jgi:hypothetical protein
MARRPATVHRTFDDQLEGFVEFVRANAANLARVDPDALASALTSQRSARQKDLELESQYREFHLQLSSEQAARYEPFQRALAMARATYRGQPEKLAALAQFKRPRGRARTAPATN